MGVTNRHLSRILAWRFVGLGLALVAMLVSGAACTRREAPPPSAEVNVSRGDANAPTSALASAPVSASAPAPAFTSTPAPTPTPVRFAVVRNLEQSPYCMPYPSDMTEDTSERWEHGRHVFVMPNERARMDVAAMCPSRSLAELYAEARRDVERVAAPGAITVNTLHTGDYVLSWRAGGRIHWMKVWAQPKDAGCFVRVHVDYVEAERPRFDGVLPAISAADPGSCPAD